MKKFMFFTVVALTVISCEIPECNLVTHNESTILVDVTDQKLLSQIDREIEYFSAFAKAKKLLELEECGSSTISLAPISSNYNLSIAKASIELNTLNLTGREIAIRRDTDTLFTKLVSKYQSIKDRVTLNPDLMASTDIATVIAKSIIRLEDTNSANVFVFSDFINYSEDFNFYKSVPNGDDAKEAFKIMIGKTLFHKMKTIIDTGVIDTIFLINLTPPKKMSKQQLQKIHTFWEKAFSDMSVELVITDSLTNL